MDRMTKTERLRRLRLLAAASRDVSQLPRNVRVEVGSRLSPIRVVDHVPSNAEIVASADDLDTFWSLPEAAGQEAIAGAGMIVHLYLSGAGDGGELESVTVGWVGTKDREPVLINLDGRAISA